MSYYRLPIWSSVCLMFFSCSFLFAGNISQEYKYAWSNKSGYVNFENVIVGDATISGYAWSKNGGWIHFNPAQGGVLNDGKGNLSGYAWGENFGWINFHGVTIDTSVGKFSGTATGILIGTLTFDCPTYCDVRTDWRPAAIVSELGTGRRVKTPQKQPPVAVKCLPSNNNLDFEAFLQKTLSEKKRLGIATRLEMALLALNIREIPIFRDYKCQNFHIDTVGKQVPFFTCQVAEKARIADIISQTNTAFHPLQPLSRIEAYAIMMKAIRVLPPATEKDWKLGVMKQAIALGFTVRTTETFEPERYLTIPEMYILTQRFNTYYRDHAPCVIQI